MNKVSPMFMEDKDRHRADSMSRTSYQVEDKRKKEDSALARIGNKRINSQQILKRIEVNDDLVNKRENNKLMTKAVSNMIYDHRSNISNRLEFY